MKKVAPELDSLMWTLAEEGNDRAIDEFGTRYPEMRGELLRRMAMVKGLRGAKIQPKEAVVPIPRFVPKETRGSSIQSRRLTMIVGGLVLAAVAAATFTVTTLMTPAPHVPVPQQPVPEVSSGSGKPSTEAPVVKAPPVDNSTTEPDNGGVVMGGTSEAAPRNTRNNLRVDQAPLLSLLDMMGEVGGVKIIPAPGLANVTVGADYEQKTVMEMLQDLGKKYSFTSFEQSDGTILVVPNANRPGQPVLPDTAGGMRSRKVG